MGRVARRRRDLVLPSLTGSLSQCVTLPLMVCCCCALQWSRERLARASFAPLRQCVEVAEGRYAALRSHRRLPCRNDARDLTRL